MKDRVFKAYKQFEVWAKLQFGIPVFKTLRSNWGGEYLGKTFNEYLQTQGTMCQLTTHDTLEYNEISEQLNRTLLERTCALLHASKLLKNLWGEAINHVIWLKNRIPTHALSDGKMSYKLLYHKKPDLRNVQEWGSMVWVHTLSGSKLDWRAKEGRWIGLKDESNGNQIYWPDKHLVTVKHSIRFANDNIPSSSILITQPIQGEKPLKNPMNQQNNLKNEQTTKEKELTDNEQLETPVQTQTNVQVPLELIATSRSHWIKRPTRYVKDIQSGIGTADNRPEKPNLPAGIQISEPILDIEGEKEDDSQLEHAMAAAISEIKAINPQSLKEAMRRPDHPK